MPLLRPKKVIAAGSVATVLLGAIAAAAPDPAERATDTKVLLLVGAFVVGLLMFVWLASKLMGPQKPLEEENPFIPFGIGDEEDQEAGDS
ncbi:MAG: hypothetical protein ACWA5T_03425 [Parvularcula sp.]